MNLNFWKLIALSAITASLYVKNASASLDQSQCSEIRLDQNGGSMEGIPVRTQYDALCYAHAAVDLIDAKMGNKTQPSSPLDAAAHFKATTPASLLEAFGHYWHHSPLYEDYIVNTAFGKTEWGYGITLNLLNHLIQHGVCPESKIASEQALIAKDHGDPFPLGDYHSQLKLFWDKYKKNPDSAIAEEVQGILKGNEKEVQKRLQDTQLLITKNQSAQELLLVDNASLRQDLERINSESNTSDSRQAHIRAIEQLIVANENLILLIQQVQSSTDL